MKLGVSGPGVKPRNTSIQAKTSKKRKMLNSETLTNTHQTVHTAQVLIKLYRDTGAIGSIPFREGSTLANCKPRCQEKGLNQ